MFSKQLLSVSGCYGSTEGHTAGSDFCNIDSEAGVCVLSFSALWCMLPVQPKRLSQAVVGILYRHVKILNSYNGAKTS